MDDIWSLTISSDYLIYDTVYFIVLFFSVIFTLTFLCISACVVDMHSIIPDRIYTVEKRITVIHLNWLDMYIYMLK